MDDKIKEVLKITLDKFIKENTDLWHSDYKSYQEKYDEELIEYLHLDKNRFGIPIDLFVDDGYAYVHHNHPLWVYMCNGYDVNDDVIPISVEDNPHILIPNVNLKVSDADFRLVKEFIQINKDLIIKLANDVIKNVDFLKSVKCFALSEQHIKGSGLLFEMARISRDETGLPTDIFVDTTVRQTKHGKRIKFKADDTQHYSSEYTPITISDNPIIPIDYKVDPHLFKIIKQFVILNKELLENLSEGNITIEYFIKNMVRFNNGKPIQQQENNFNYQMVTKCMNDFIMIKSHNEMFNFLNTNNQIISPKQWFTNAQPFVNNQNGTYAMVQIDEMWYWLSENGELKQMD